MRAFLAVLLALAGLAAAPAAAQLEGRYELASINGHALPAESPTEPGVSVKRGGYWFHADGRFTVAVTVDMHEDENTQVASGTYVAVRDSLRLTIRDEEAVAFRWARDGEALRLYDEQENEYRLVRQAPAAAGEPWSPGTWNAVRMNGQALPAPWARHPQLTLARLSFTFTGDGQAIARIAGTMEGEPMDEEDKARYTVVGDRLTILDEDGSVDEEYVWTIHDGTLQVVDARGHTYTLTRVPGP